MLSNGQKNLIDKVSRRNGSNFTVSIDAGSKKGDNYLGHIYLVHVKENESGRNNHYVLKCAEKNKDVRTQLPIHEAYQREIFLYQKVLPQFDKFQEKYRVKHPFKAFIGLLGCSSDEGDEYLLMENLKYNGFSMLERKKTMDDEHVSFVFKELAKFHSLSLGMKHLEPETYKNLSVNVGDFFEKYSKITKSFEESMEKKCAVAMKIVKGHQKATEALIKYQRDFGSIWDEVRKEKNHLVITHGDPWCNNMFFKYDDRSFLTKPTSMCFVDWQISKTQTPLADLCYFLFLSGSKDILENHQKYLDIYYRTLDENLRSIGCDTASVFPRELFREHWLKYSKMAVSTALTNMQAMLKDEKDAKSFAEMAQGGNNLVEQFWKEDEFGDAYCQRIKNIILMMVENKYM